MFRITNGLLHGTSTTDTWRLKPALRTQLLVDRSPLCTKAFSNFSQLILKSQNVRAEKKKTVRAGLGRGAHRPARVGRPPRVADRALAGGTLRLGLGG